MLVDTHAHISDPKLASDIELIVERARQAGVTTIINVGDNVERSKVALAQAEQYASMWAAAAVHPHEADSLDDDSLEQLRVMAKNPKVIAIGEIGLDYYYDTPDRQV